MFAQIPLVSLVLLLSAPVQGPVKTEARHAELGASASPFSLELVLQGPPPAQITWEALDDNVVVLEFWATWCVPCVAMIPHFNELAKEFENEPVRFISISDEEESVVRSFLKKKRINGWVALDTDRSMFNAYTTGSVPLTVLVDRRGRIASLSYPADVTSSVIRALLNGEKVHLPQAGRFDDLLTDLPPAARPGTGSKGTTDETPPSLVEIRITPLTPGETSTSISIGPGYIVGRGWTVADILGRVYDLPTSRITVPEPLAETRYEYVVRVPPASDDALHVDSIVSAALGQRVGIPPGKEGAVDTLFRTAVEAAFPQVQHEKRRVDVYVLRRATEDHPAGLQPTASISKSGYITGEGSISFVGTDMPSLCAWLAEILKRPVVDETGITDRYDIYCKYDVSNPESLLEALPEQVGLRLEPGQRELEFITLTASDDK